MDAVQTIRPHQPMNAEILSPDAVAQRCEMISLQEWQELVDDHQQSGPLQHSQWIKLLVDHYGFKLSIPAIRSNGQIRAATVFLETRTLGRARKLLSLPFTDCFTPLGDDDESLLLLFDGVQSQFGHDFRSVAIRTDRPLPGYPHRRDWVRHRIQLTTDMADLLPTLPASVRRNIRKATKNDLQFVRRTDTKALDEFFRLHVLTRKKLGMPVQSRAYFRRLQREILDTELGFVGMVRSGSTPIAAAVFVQYKGNMLYKYGASDPAALHLRPNDYLFLNVIETAARDCHTFDFGVTDFRDEGLRRFKRKWGAEEQDIYDICIAGELVESTGESRALKMASAVIRRSPTIVCRALGKALYRYSP